MLQVVAAALTARVGLGLGEVPVEKGYGQQCELAADYNLAAEELDLERKLSLSRRSPVWIVCRPIGILLISGLAGAALVRLAPGFGTEEQALDPRLSALGRKALERSHDAERNPFVFYLHFLAGLARGDAGQSTVYGKSVRDLIQDRASTTLIEVGGGLAGGWIAAVGLGLGVALSRSATARLPAFALSGAMLSTPSAVVAMVCLLLKLAPSFAIAAVIFPRVFPHAYEQIRAALAAPHVLTARAAGMRGTRLLLYHVAPAVAMPLLALTGVSVTLAFGAAIPVEALSDTPGVGQLAWRAALGRDVPVLVAVTLLLTIVTLLANTAADLAMLRNGERSA
jgi:peptide/nickel transport system permease protein